MVRIGTGDLCNYFLLSPAQEETDLVSEAQVSATSMLEASSTVQISSTVQASSTAQASSSLVQASSTITQPSSSIDSVGSPTHAQAVPTNIIISVLDIKSGIELENAEEQGKAFKSNKNSGNYHTFLPLPLSYNILIMHVYMYIRIPQYFR